MTVDRAFAVAHNLDVPEAKKKFWPQWSTVVVSREGRIEDVIQHFEAPSLASNAAHAALYPRSAQFTVKAGEMFATLPEFQKKLEETAGVWKLEEKMKRPNQPPEPTSPFGRRGSS